MLCALTIQLSVWWAGGAALEEAGRRRVGRGSQWWRPFYPDQGGVLCESRQEGQGGGGF